MNRVYGAFRDCLRDMGMDEEHKDGAAWSPFSEFIRPGDTVVIKPNLVLNTANPDIQDCTTTHPSLIRPVIDYAWKALWGEGKIIVGDACASEANFDEIVDRTGIRKMIEILQERGMKVELRDFRAVKVTTENGIWTGEQSSNTTEAGKVVQLNEHSLFAIEKEKYKHATLHGAGYDIAETNRHHHGDVQEYCVSETILRADVVISMPKMKTHRKAGFTCCLKNLVGINVDKNYLPHFAMGSTNMGGDEMPAISGARAVAMGGYNFVRKHVISHTWQFLGGPAAGFLRKVKGKEKAPDSEKAAEATSAKNAQADAAQAGQPKDTDTDLAKWLHNRISGQNVAAGAWAGNETICNMILDLNRVFLCCGKDGELRERTDRRFFYVADGIRSGMGNGPIHPAPVQVGAVAAGYNGLAIDTAILRLFGINEQSITLYRKADGLDYMHPEEKGDILYNGKQITAADRFGCELIAPDDWVYEKL